MEKVAVTGHLGCIRWLTIKSKDSLGSVQPESLVLPWNDEENKKWQPLPLTTEYLRAIPRGTQAFLAQRALLPEARHLQISGWRTQGQGSTHGWSERMKESWSLQRSSFLHQQQQADSPLPFPLPASRPPRLRKGLRSLVQPESVGQIWMLVMKPWFLCLQLFGGLAMPIFCTSFSFLEITYIYIHTHLYLYFFLLTKPWPIGSAFNAWFTDTKTEHDK